MQASELLTEIEQRGASICANGDRLRVTGDDLLDDDLRAQLRHLKPQLLALLQSGAASESSASDHPAMDAFLAAVEAARHPDVPGLVKISVRLVELWQAAELEIGWPLDLSGRRRRIHRRGVLPPSSMSARPTIRPKRARTL